MLVVKRRRALFKYTRALYLTVRDGIASRGIIIFPTVVQRYRDDTG